MVVDKENGNKWGLEGGKEYLNIDNSPWVGPMQISLSLPLSFDNVTFAPYSISFNWTKGLNPEIINCLLRSMKFFLVSQNKKIAVLNSTVEALFMYF